MRVFELIFDMNANFKMSIKRLNRKLEMLNIPHYKNKPEIGRKKATHSLNFLSARHATPYILLNSTGNIIYIKWGRSQQKFVLAPGKTITLMCTFESIVAPTYGVYMQTNSRKSRCTFCC